MRWRKWRGRSTGRDDADDRRGWRSFHPTDPPVISHSTSAIMLLHRLHAPSPSTWPLSSLAFLFSLPPSPSLQRLLSSEVTRDGLAGAVNLEALSQMPSQVYSLLPSCLVFRSLCFCHSRGPAFALVFAPVSRTISIASFGRY